MVDPWPPRYDFPLTWRDEWLIERRALRERLAACTDPAVAALLGDLADQVPGTEAEWLALVAAIRDAEHLLRQAGRLPDYPWPAEGAGEGGHRV